jgi:hypothetical protein
VRDGTQELCPSERHLVLHLDEVRLVPAPRQQIGAPPGLHDRLSLNDEAEVD